ncbi:uncharacterized protein LOC142765207 [Rhipicephalus microplus]|uniref:uncharacterized protein LOC142765207 n=1 Tax=Rhipicephalus microplus TaxID=6941 RepID=UPI003F6C0927
MLRTIKDLLNKSSNWPLALLSYCNTPGITGYIPAKLLMGHSLWTRLPVPPATLLPKPSCAAYFHRCDTAQHHRQCRDFNRRRTGKDSCLLVEGESVWIWDTQCAGTVLSPAQRPRCYVVQRDAGALVCNHRHLVPQQSQASGDDELLVPQQSQASVSGDFSSITPLPEESPTPLQIPTHPVPECSSPPPAADVVTSSPAASPQVVPATPSKLPASSVCTRSGHSIRPPLRLNL